MKVKTEQLKELVNKSINGASNNKLIPITQLMGIRRSGGSLILTTTDATNYLYIDADSIFDDPSDSDIQVTVFAEQFAKLISKMTSEYIELNIKNDTLEVEGNGTYTLELPLDENGELIKYPDPLLEIPKGYSYEDEIKISEVKTVIDSIKPSLATTLELPSITNYFVGENVVATDRYKIASFDNKMCNKEILVSAQLMDLLSICDGDISYKIDKDYMIFESKNCTIFSKQSDDISEYPIDAIENLIKEEFKSVCKVNKNEFIALLERISLFVGKYDDKAVRLYFEKNGIRVSNKNRKSNECIDYIDSKNYESYDCVIDVDMLLTQLKAYSSDSVEIHYNNEASIKFVDDKVIQIVALMED